MEKPLSYTDYIGDKKNDDVDSKSENNKSKTKLKVYSDNYFQHLFYEKQNEKIDYKKLKNKLKSEQNESSFYYFFQKCNHNQKVYHKIRNVLNSSGWKVFKPIDQIFQNGPYAHSVEMNALTARAIHHYHQDSKKFEKQDFVFCINHFYYLPLITKLTNKNDVNNIKLICYPDKLNDLLLEKVDSYTNMFNLNLGLED